MEEPQEPSKKRKVAPEVALKSNCYTFFEQHWELVDSLTPPASFAPAELTQLAGRHAEEKDILLQFIDNKIWDILVCSVNKALSANRNHNNKDTRRKNTNNDELKQFYGIFMAIENTYGNSVRSLRKHFKAVTQQYGRIPKLGYDRFSALLSAFSPSVDDIKAICDLLHGHFWLISLTFYCNYG